MDYQSGSKQPHSKGWRRFQSFDCGMYILGLTTLGDAAASLVCDGKLVAAAEEERFSRVKHHIVFPHNALQFCLDRAGIKIGDVEHASLHWKPWILRHKATQTLKSPLISPDMLSRAYRSRRRAGQRIAYQIWKMKYEI